MSSSQALRPAHHGDDREEFLRVLRLDMTQLPERLSRKVTPTKGADPRDAETLRSHVEELSQELYFVLRRYLLFLEGFGHGGWSQQEEREIERIVATLDRAGYTIHPSGHGELGGVAETAQVGEHPRHDRHLDEGEDQFSWDRVSSPEER